MAYGVDFWGLFGHFMLQEPLVTAKRDLRVIFTTLATVHDYSLSSVHLGNSGLYHLHLDLLSVT